MTSKSPILPLARSHALAKSETACCQVVVYIGCHGYLQSLGTNDIVKLPSPEPQLIPVPPRKTDVVKFPSERHQERPIEWNRRWAWESPLQLLEGADGARAVAGA